MRQQNQVLAPEIDWTKGVLLWTRAIPNDYVDNVRLDKYDWHCTVVLSREKFERITNGQYFKTINQWYYETINVPQGLKSDVPALVEKKKIMADVRQKEKQEKKKNLRL